MQFHSISNTKYVDDNTRKKYVIVGHRRFHCAAWVLVLQITYGKIRVYLRTQRRLNKSLYTAVSLS